MVGTIITTWYARQTADAQRKLADYVATRANEHIRLYGQGDVGFTAWLAVADRKCSRALGVGIFDIGDWLWRDAYDSGEGPYAALREALRQDDTFGALFGGEE